MERYILLIFSCVVCIALVGLVIHNTQDTSDITGQASFAKKIKKALQRAEKQAQQVTTPMLTQPPQLPKPQSTITCTDSDNGKTYGQKGTTIGIRAWWDITPANIKQEIDTCTTICQGSVGSGTAMTGPCLIEYYCASHPQQKGPSIFAAFEVKNCEYGCQDGTCKPIQSQQFPTPAPTPPTLPRPIPFSFRKITQPLQGKQTSKTTNPQLPTFSLPPEVGA